MVERSLSMREVPGSIPGSSTCFLYFFLFDEYMIIIYNLIKKSCLCFRRFYFASGRNG